MDGFIISTAFITLALSVISAWIIGRKAGQHSIEQGLQAAILGLQEQQKQTLDNLKHDLKQHSENRERQLINQVDVQFQIVKAEFAMLAEEHIMELARRQNTDLDDQTVEDAEVVLKTKVGKFY